MEKRINMKPPNVGKLSQNFEEHGNNIIKCIDSGLDIKKEKIRGKDPKDITESEKEILKCSEADYISKLLKNLQKKNIFKKIDECVEVEQIKPILQEIRDSTNLK